MPVIEEKRQGDLKTVHFEESPVMSTYLVAIVVGLFDYVESQTSDGMYEPYVDEYQYFVFDDPLCAF